MKASCAVLASCLLLMGAVAPAAEAEFSISEFGGAITSGGEFSRQAGAHADLTTRIEFAVNDDPEGEFRLEGNVKEVDVSLPAGIVGNATAVPTCRFSDLIGGEGEIQDCPVETQIGIATVETPSGAVFYPVYNIDRPPDAPALFAFNYLGAVVPIAPRLRATDFGVSTHVGPTSEGVPVTGTEVTIWGVPADESHNAERFVRGSESAQGAISTADRSPLLTMPTSCSGTASVTSASANAWQSPADFSFASFDGDFNGVPFITEGCERLRFEPTVSVDPGSRSTAATTGVDVEIKVPQSTSPDGLATAHVRRTVVTLPEGFAISPSAAAGRAVCSVVQIGIGSNDPPSCPGSSSLGTVKVETPLLDEELEGEVFLAKQNENPFGSLLALYLAIKGPGFYVKLAGKIALDPATGQVSTFFNDLPQLPFDSFGLSLRGGPHAPLVAPSACGSYMTHVEMTSWASAMPVTLDAPMSITEGCNNGGFDPKLRAGTSNPAAGKASPFLLQITRDDGEQNISRIDTTLPEGLLAKLAGIPLCGEGQATTGACPAASQIGRATVGAGAGSSPLYVPQPGKAPTAIYLAGPYKGAPYSLVVKVPAQAGPFDLGTVAVRSGISIDPVTAQASVKSDPLPQILQGIPIAYRDVRVEVDREGFIQNPTSCDPMRVESNLFGAAGATASPSARFQAANCTDLAFKPKLALKFSGPTHRSAHPKLKATLTMPKKGANIGKAVVTLPKTEFLENAHIRTICTRVQYAADNCPKGSVYGYAKAWTPLLDRPLQGPVYLRSSNHTLPDLVASLDGQIHVDLAGRIDSPGGKIRNTFWAVPDAPVTKFVLTMQGGAKGLLVNNEELCRAKPRAKAEFTGQNGKRSVSNPLVKIGCGRSGDRRK
jgi:hypothetical protein